MNLVEKLLKADVGRAKELETKKIVSKKLAKILGGEEPVEITISEIPAKRMNDIAAMQLTRKGDFDINRSFDAKLVTLTDGVIDPNVKDQALIKHFGCSTPKELVELLFGSEITDISDEIAMLSGIGRDNGEEIKN